MSYFHKAQGWVCKRCSEYYETDSETPPKFCEVCDEEVHCD